MNLLELEKKVEIWQGNREMTRSNNSYPGTQGNVLEPPTAADAGHVRARMRTFTIARACSNLQAVAAQLQTLAGRGLGTRGEHRIDMTLLFITRA